MFNRKKQIKVEGKEKPKRLRKYSPTVWQYQEEKKLEQNKQFETSRCVIL